MSNSVLKVSDLELADLLQSEFCHNAMTVEVLIIKNWHQNRFSLKCGT